MFDRTGSERLWTSFSNYVEDRFGQGVKVYKVTLDAGFSCPNIDGTVATGGSRVTTVPGSDASILHTSFSPPRGKLRTAT